MTTTELDMKVQEIRELQTMLEELTAELENAKDMVKNAMIERGTEELVGAGWKATWHTVTSSRLDSKALKAADPETFEKYTKTSTVCRFCIA